MKLIVGLGNPGSEYQHSRHNAGFWIVDLYATKHGAQYHYNNKLRAELARVNLSDGEVVWLAKPDTYMNLSGHAFQAIINWYKIPPEKCLVVHDDVALPLGKIRYQNGGGAGGQHGVEHIIEQLGGNKNFSRLKFGVGPDPGGDRRAHYVLSAIPEEDAEVKEKSLQLALKSLDVWIKDGALAAANKFNGVDLRPQPEAG